MLPLGVGTSEAELSCEVVFLFKARVKGSWIQAGAGSAFGVKPWVSWV